MSKPDPTECPHAELSPPPAGETLRTCNACDAKIVECSTCTAKSHAGPHIAALGWNVGGYRAGKMGATIEWRACPACAVERSLR